jgi:hypothetical protein
VHDLHRRHPRAEAGFRLTFLVDSRSPSTAGAAIRFKFKS